jgi:hypothetical protein
MYENDEYILMDGEKRARVHPTNGVKQVCPLSPLLFALYINDMGREISEGIEGAVTGDRVNCVSHMLYADDLGLTSNDVGEMQTMLNKLCTYAEKKGLYSSYNCASFCFFCLARLVSGFFQTSAEMPFEAYIVM